MGQYILSFKKTGLRYLRCLYASIFLLVITFTTDAVGATFTVENIIDGIGARRSKIQDLEFVYSITDENHDAFYTQQAERAEQLKQSFPPQDGQNIEFKIPRILTKTYHLFADENKRAFEIFDVNVKEGSRNLDIKAVFDGQNLKLLNVREKNGVIQRVATEEAIRFPTLSKALNIGGMDIPDYLNRQDVETFITNERIEDGAFIVELVTYLTTIPSPNAPLKLVTEYQIHFDAQKDFWPVKIEEYHELIDTSTDQKVRKLDKRTVADDFVQRDGVFFPTKIRTDTFHRDFKYSIGSRIPQQSDTVQLLTSP